jgi:hypothetical protein
LVTAIGAAVASAAQFQQRLNEKKTGALDAARGFGSTTFSLNESDFNTPGGLTPPEEKNNNTLLLAGALLGGYLLLSNNE